MQEKRTEKIILNPAISKEADDLTWHTLSITLTSLVGREEEFLLASSFLRRPNIRLLTITGTGGVGKTRLAIQVVAELQDEFAAGTLFVPLAAIRDSTQLITAIAHISGLRESADSSLFEHVKAFLRPKHILLFLDSFEHLLPATPFLTTLLSYCPSLKILVTSRSALHIQGEQEFPILPLPLPTSDDVPTFEAIERSAAVTLFVNHARAIKHDFSLTRDNAPIVAEICACLDGLPLALELAAACIKLLPPKALLARLYHHLPLVTKQGEGVPAHQKTLHDTIAWSYDLLTSEQQTLFRRIAVFVRGCQLEAVEALYTVLGDSSLAVLDGIAQLVDKSLLLLSEEADREPRLLMLETIREFALEKLTASGELASMQRAHATYYIHLVEQAEPELYHHQQQVWLLRLEQEHPNIRAALVCLETLHERERLAHLVGSLGWFWYMHGFLNEGKRWAEQILTLGGQDLPEALRGKILSSAGVFAGFLGQNEQSFTRCQESLPLCKAYGDTRNLSASVYMLVHTYLALGDVPAARTLAEETLTFVRSTGDRWAIGALHCMLGSIALYEGQYEYAWQLHEQGIAVFEEEGDLCMHGLILMMEANVAVAQGDEEQARGLIQRGCEMFRQVGASWSLGSYFNFWGQIALNGGHTQRACFLLQEAADNSHQTGDQQGLMMTYTLLSQVAASERDYSRAGSLANQVIQLARLLQKKEAITACLDELVAVAAQQGATYWAAQLWGAIEHLSQPTNLSAPPSIDERQATLVRLLQDQLGEEMFASARAEGYRMTPEQALAAHPGAKSTRSVKQSADAAGAEQASTAALTKREREVLWHLAQGRSNREIAEQLALTPATVNSYLRTIYGKLGVTSRTSAVRYAIDHNLM